MKMIKQFISYGSLLFAWMWLSGPMAAQTSIKRHPGEHLHYQITLQGGDVDKVTNVTVNLRSSMAAPSTQPAAQTEFGTQCKKSAESKIWNCDVEIPQGIADGDYRLYHVGVSAANFGKSYDEDFSVPTVPIQNSSTFTPPSKVTVTPQP